MKKITEADSRYRGLEKMSTGELLLSMNAEDKTVAFAVEQALPALGRLVDAVYECISLGGRLFYIGAGTSGRLGILDASECPPTFGVPQGMVIGLIAGGDSAIRKAVEFAEDDPRGAWRDLAEWSCGPEDFILGIAASGTTPYVTGGLEDCRKHGIPTGCITCNPDAPITRHADFPVVVVTGPEFVTGSTRLKAGTAQKMVLNMLTTSVMIKLGRVLDNKMVDMQLANNKLVERGIQMIMERYKLDRDKARLLLEKYGSVRAVISHREG